MDATDRPVVDIAGLTKYFGGFTAVRGMSLRIMPGEIFGLLGPNGAGKTTTIRMLMGILVPSAGSARIMDLDCQTQRPDVMRHVGYLPDDPVFYDYLRGTELLRFVARMHGMSAQEAVAESARLLDEFDLQEAAEEFAVNYSTGMKKKLALAMAMIHRPGLLVLDEPTNGLDPRAARDVVARLHAFVDAGGSVLLSTHLLDMAERHCSRVAILHRGELAAVGPMDELRERFMPGGSLESVFLEVTRDPDAVEAAVDETDRAQEPAE